MAKFEQNNQFWRQRSKHGRSKLFESPELLWEAACEYFEWCESHPLNEEKGFAFQGVVTHDTFAKLRSFTIEGLTLYLGCSTSYFRNFKYQNDPIKEADFMTVIEQIEQVIYNQQYSAAAAELLNPNIVARKLGIKDGQDFTTGGEKLASLPPIFIERV